MGYAGQHLHERKELTRLKEVEGSINERAKQFSPDAPMLAEDLAQEGCEAVIRLQLPGKSPRGQSQRRYLPIPRERIEC